MSRLSHQAALVFAALFLAGALASHYLDLAAGHYAFVAWIAVLDVVLVLMVYHRNPGLKDL